MEWRDIKGYEGYYQVSNLGNIRSLNRRVWHSGNNCFMDIKGRDIKVNNDKNGYPRVTLHKKGKLDTIHVHQLVAQAFMGHERCGHALVVDHIDNDPSNNNVDNLQLVSSRYNTSKGISSRLGKMIGSSFHSSTGKWQSSISINGKQHHLGLFNTEEEACDKYNETLREYETTGRISVS